MKIAVIGSNGFIGSNLVSALISQGHEVVECDLPKVDIRYIKTLDCIEGCSVVFHLGVLPLNQCKNDYNNCITTNILGTANVMKAVEIFGIKRVIYSSASSVYGNPLRLPIREDHPLIPITLYGLTKLASEHIIRVFTNDSNRKLSFRASYPSYVIFRFTNVYGEGQRHGIIPDTIKKLLNNQEISIFGTGEQTRDFVYIGDVVKYLIKAMDWPIYSVVCNLGSSRQTSIYYVVNQCAKELKIIPSIKKVPYDFDRNTFQADISLLRSLYANIVFVPLEEGIKRTVEWWKKELKNGKLQSSNST